jgi:quinol monooxygenase YgiN
MSTKPITVVVIFEAQAGKEAELRKALLSLILPTRKEVGCIDYDMHVCSNNPKKILFYQNWTSKRSYYAHLKSQHVMAATPWIEQLCAAQTEVGFWEKIA